MAMKINQPWNEHWGSDFQDVIQYFTFARQPIFLNMMLMTLLRTQTEIDLRLGRKHVGLLTCKMYVCTEFIMLFLPSGDCPEKILNTPWPAPNAYRCVSHINPTTPHKWHIHLAYSRVSDWVMSLLLPSQNRLRIRHAYIGQRLVIKV
jgi:hypothetical protein